MVGRRAGFWAPCWRGPTAIYGFAGVAAPTGSAAERDFGRPVGVARRRYMALPAWRRQQGRPPSGILGALLAWPDGRLRLCRRGGANMVGRRRKAGRRQAAARNFCEDFAPPELKHQKTAAESLPPLLTYLKNSLFCVLFRSLFLHNLRQRLLLKLFKQDFLDSAKLLMESARGIL